MAELHIIGQILEAQGFEDRSLFVKYSIRAGQFWTALEGFTEGQTHLSTTSVIESGIHSLSQPIDVHYSSRGLQGWPRLEFRVWGVDWLGKCNISAYGFMSIPTHPGYYELICSTWRPVGDFRRRIIDYITGYRMHLVDPSDVISNGSNRHVIQSLSMGTIKVQLHVASRGFDSYGVDI